MADPVQGKKVQQIWEDLTRRVNQANNNMAIPVTDITNPTAPMKLIKQEQFLHPSTTKEDAITDDDRIIILSGTGDSKTAKMAKPSALLYRELTHIETNNVLAMNPMAGSIPIANSANTKAYNADVAKLLNPNYVEGINVNLTSNSTISYNDDFAIGANSISFMIAGNISFPSSDYSGTFICGAKNADGSHAFGIYASSESYKISVRAYDGNSDHITTSPLCYVSPNKLNKLLCILDRSDNTIKVYLNNILASKTNLNVGFGSITASANPVVFVNSPYIAGKVERFIFFNYALSDEELTVIYNSGRPDRAILPDYMKWGSNVNLIPTLDFTTEWIPGNAGTSSKSSNSFTTPGLGGLYKQGILSNVANYNIKIRIKNTVTVAITETGNQTYIYNIPPSSEYITYNFLYTGRTTSNSNSDFYIILLSAGTCDVEILDITQAGAIADLEPSGIVCNSSGKVTAWTDSSDNNNDATVSGTPDLVLVKAEDYEGQGLEENITKVSSSESKTITNPTLSIPINHVLEYLTVKNPNSSAMTISLGTTASGTDLINAQTIATGKAKAFPIPVYERDENSPTTLYITASTQPYDINTVTRRIK